MRRPFPIVILAAIAAVFTAGAASADSSRTLLGSNGEVYTVQRGAYGDLFADVPAGAGSNTVLALDTLRDGKLKRALVPATGGPEDETDPALAYDTVANRVYVVWQSDHVFSLVGRAADGWQPVVDLAGDPASTKRNPQLATSIARYQTLDEDGILVTISRTLLHLVWYDDSAAGAHLLYTAAAIEGSAVVPASQAFDLRGVAGNAPGDPNAAAAPPSLLQKPVARRGRDNDNVGLAFIDNERGELVTLELRPIEGALHYFADKARAVVIEIGRGNRGLSPSAIADKARAVVIEIGRSALHPVVADFLSKRFLDALAASDPASEIEPAAGGAWRVLLGEGIALQEGSTSIRAHVMELATAAADGSSRTVDVRWVSRRALPGFPDADLKLFLSPRAQEASVAWNAPTAVRYRETNPAGWEPIKNLALGPSLTREQAFKLVEQRLEEQ
jgi:hypothetical protein